MKSLEKSFKKHTQDTSLQIQAISKEWDFRFPKLEDTMKVNVANQFKQRKNTLEQTMEILSQDIETKTKSVVDENVDKWNNSANDCKTKVEKRFVNIEEASRMVN